MNHDNFPRRERRTYRNQAVSVVAAFYSQAVAQKQALNKEVASAS